VSSKNQAFAALQPGQLLSPFEYEPGPLGAEQVEIKLEYCGICHSDLSMIDNGRGFSAYPLIVGHEVGGTAAASKARDRIVLKHDLS
jgi:uncharacterized zinc-type alcohol dehydrogenase-like protein